MKKYKKISNSIFHFKTCSCLGFSYIPTSVSPMDGQFSKSRKKKENTCRAIWNLIVYVIIHLSIFLIFSRHLVITISSSAFCKTQHEQLFAFKYLHSFWLISPALSNIDAYKRARVKVSTKLYKVDFIEVWLSVSILGKKI